MRMNGILRDAAILIVAFALIIFVSASASSRVTPDPLGATVKIIADGGHGSGVHIGGGVIVTAAHVVGQSRNVTFKTTDGLEFQAHVLATNTNYDVALLISDRFVHRASLPLSCADIPAGGSARLVGNPLGIDFVTMRGHVAGEPRALGPWARVYVIDATAAPGMSGGPAARRSTVMAN